MDGIRTFMLRHRGLAALLLAAALCLKALVPAGYMIDSGTSVLTLTICDAQGGNVRQIAVPIHGENTQDDGQAASGGCPYATLSMHALGGADPIQLAAALAFLLLLGFAPLIAPALRRSRYATPPLRGPPATA